MKLLLNNSILILFLFLANSNILLSQIEYAVVENQRLYTYYSEEETSNDEAIISRDVKSGEELITWMDISPSGNIFCAWVKKQEKIVSVWASLGSSNNRPKAIIQTFILETIDSFERKRKTEILVDSLVRMYGDELHALLKISAERKTKENTRSVYPLADWFRVFDLAKYNCKSYYPIQFDLIPDSDSTYYFYLTNKKEFSIFYFKYPKNKATKSRRSHWQEIVTYSIDTIPFISGSPYLSLGRDSTKKLPFGKHHLYQSIQDTSFFKGSFKIIKQGNNTFYINVHLGNIYHIGDDAIVKVGEVNVKNYPRWLLSKPLFIEDRDANELIFLADVKRINEERPFPKVVVQKNRLKMLRQFPGLRMN